MCVIGVFRRLDLNVFVCVCATQLLQSNFHGNDASLDLEIFRDVVMDEGTLRVHQVELVVNA